MHDNEQMDHSVLYRIRKLFVIVNYINTFQNLFTVYKRKNIRGRWIKDKFD